MDCPVHKFVWTMKTDMTGLKSAVTLVLIKMMLFVMMMRRGDGIMQRGLEAHHAKMKMHHAELGTNHCAEAGDSPIE